MDLFNLTRPRCYFRLHYLSERLNFNYRVKSRVIFFFKLYVFIYYCITRYTLLLCSIPGSTFYRAFATTVLKCA